MKLEIGPVLNFRKHENNEWKVSILIGLKQDAIPVLNTTDDNSAVSGPTLLIEWNGTKVYRYDFSTC